MGSLFCSLSFFMFFPIFLTNHLIASSFALTHSTGLNQKILHQSGAIVDPTLSCQPPAIAMLAGRMLLWRFPRQQVFFEPHFPFVSAGSAHGASVTARPGFRPVPALPPPRNT
jgi:hypothetical protein